MQPFRSVSSKVDQFLIICWRASFSDFRQMSTSFWMVAPVPRPYVTLAAIWQVSWMLTVGTCCARAASANARRASAAATAMPVGRYDRRRAVGSLAVEHEVAGIGASPLGGPPRPPPAPAPPGSARPAPDHP